MDRQTRKQDIEHAYDLQARAAVAGAARFTTIGIGLAVLGHYTWPTFRLALSRAEYIDDAYDSFRRQTLPFKGFLVSVCS